MEILYQEPIMEMPSPYLGIFTAFIIVGVGLFGLLLAVRAGEDSLMATLGIGSLLCFIAAVIILLKVDAVETNRNEYMVRFNEEVNFAEIYEKYDIVEQKGDIWTLRDKEIK